MVDGRCDGEGDAGVGDAPAGYDASDGERLGSILPVSTSFELKEPACRLARATSVRRLCTLGPAEPLPLVEGGDGVFSTTEVTLLLG